MSFDPQLLALVIGERNRQAEEARRSQLLSERSAQEALQVGMGIAMNPNADVSAWLPLLREQGLTPAHESALLDANKAERTARKRKEAEAETAQAGQSAAGVLTDPMLAPELGRDQVLSQLRAVEAAGNQTQLGAPGLLGQVDIARTQNQLAARSAATAAQQTRGDTLRGERFANENVLRDEFRQLANDFVVRRTSHQNVQAAFKQNDAAGDLALVMNFAKVLDPGVRVTEGDFNNIVNSGGLPGAAQQFGKFLVGKGRLSNQQRADIVKQSRAQYESAVESHRELEREFRGQAKRNKLDPRNVVIDFIPKGRAPQPPQERPDLTFGGRDPKTGANIFIDPNTGEAFMDAP